MAILPHTDTTGGSCLSLRRIYGNFLEFNNRAIKPILFVLTENIPLQQVCSWFKLHADPMEGYVKYLCEYINPCKKIGILETDTFPNVNAAQETLKALVRLFAIVICFRYFFRSFLFMFSSILYGKSTIF